MTIPTWLLLSQLSGSGDTIITITADSYSQVAERIATLLVSGNTKHVEVPVYQTGSPLGVNPETFLIGSASTVMALTITSIDEWEITGQSGYNWLNFSQTSGQSGNTVVRITASTNSSGSDRGARFSVTCRDVTKEVQITQTIIEQWDVIATYNFAGNYNTRILGGDGNYGFDDMVSVDGVMQPIATGMTLGSGVHTIMFKSRIPGRLTNTANFYNSSALTSVIINDSITEINSDSLFASCKNLTSVTLPNTLKTLGGHDNLGVFYPFDGTKVSSLNLPSSLEFIGRGTFSGMNYLTGVTIPSGCFVEEGAFLGMYTSAISAVTHSSPFSLTIPSDATVIIDDAQFGYGTNSTASTFANIIGPNFELVDHVYYAGPIAIAVDDKTLTSYTIRSGTRYIDDDCFYGCKSATTINMPSTIESVGSSSFYQLNVSGPTYIDGKVFWDDLSGYSSNALTLQSGTIGVVPSNRSYTNDSLKSVTLPGSITCINSYTFSHCRRIDSVTIEEGPKYLGGAFYCTLNYASGVSQVSLANSIEHYDRQGHSIPFRLARTNIYNNTVYFRTALGEDTVVIPNGIKKIAPYSLVNTVTAVTVPNTVKEIGVGALNSTGLTSVNLPDSVEFYQECFSGAKNLASVSLPQNQNASVSLSFKNNTAMTGLTIPDKVLVVEALNFTNALVFTTLYIGKDVRLVEDLIGNKYADEFQSQGPDCFKTIYCYAPVAPQLAGIGGMSSGGVLHYPRGADYSAWLTKLGDWTGVADL